MNLNQPAKKSEIIFIAVGCLMATLYVFSGPYSQKKITLEDLTGQLKQVEEQVQALQKFNQTVKETREKQIEKMTSQVQKSVDDDPRLQMIRKSRAPEFRLFEDFMKQIMNPTFRPSVDVQSLTYKTRVEYSGFSETEFELSASGPYVNVISFMSRLEAMPALFTIKDFDLKVGKTDAGIVTVSIKASFYQLQDDTV